MGAMQRSKGAAGERELAGFLTSHGHPAQRGRQYRGGADSPDVLRLADLLELVA